MGWTLEAAGVGSAGRIGALRWVGLAAVYLEAFRAWARDESEDMARTMAALDRALARADRWASACARFCPEPRSRPAAEASGAG